MSDRGGFFEVFRLLSMALPATAAQREAGSTEERGEVYYGALADLPFGDVKGAAEGLEKRGSGYFPSSEEWYRAADELAYRRLMEAEGRPKGQAVGGSNTPGVIEARAAFLASMRAKGQSAATGFDCGVLADHFDRAIQVRDPARYPGGAYECERCKDTGYVSRVCADGDRCAAHGHVEAEWGEHDFVVECSCKHYNSVITNRIALASHRAAGRKGARK